MLKKKNFRSGFEQLIFVVPLVWKNELALKWVFIFQAHKEVTEDGTTENTHIASSVTKLLKEIEWWGICTKNGRSNQGLPK